MHLNDNPTPLVWRTCRGQSPPMPVIRVCSASTSGAAHHSVPHYLSAGAILFSSIDSLDKPKQEKITPCRSFMRA